MMLSMALFTFAENPLSDCAHSNYSPRD
jgi:hypothetical protein